MHLPRFGRTAAPVEGPHKRIVREVVEGFFNIPPDQIPAAFRGLVGGFKGAARMYLPRVTEEQAENMLRSALAGADMLRERLRGEAGAQDHAGEEELPE